MQGGGPCSLETKNHRTCTKRVQSSWERPILSVTTGWNVFGCLADCESIRPPRVDKQRIVSVHNERGRRASLHLSHVPPSLVSHSQSPPSHMHSALFRSTSHSPSLMKLAVFDGGETSRESMTTQRSVQEERDRQERGRNRQKRASARERERERERTYRVRAGRTYRGATMRQGERKGKKGMGERPCVRWQTTTSFPDCFEIPCTPSSKINLPSVTAATVALLQNSYPWAEDAGRRRKS